MVVRPGHRTVLQPSPTRPRACRSPAAPSSSSPGRRRRTSRRGEPEHWSSSSAQAALAKLDRVAVLGLVDRLAQRASPGAMAPELPPWVAVHVSGTSVVAAAAVPVTAKKLSNTKSRARHMAPDPACAGRLSVSDASQPLISDPSMLSRQPTSPDFSLEGARGPVRRRAPARSSSRGGAHPASGRVQQHERLALQEAGGCRPSSGECRAGLGRVLLHGRARSSRQQRVAGDRRRRRAERQPRRRQDAGAARRSAPGRRSR